MTRKTLLLTISSFAFLVSSGGPAEANDRDYSIGIGGGGQFLPAQSMDALTADKGMGLARLELGIPLPSLASPLPQWFPSIQLGWSVSNVGGRSFERIESDLDLDTLTLEYKLAYKALGFMRGYGKAGLAYQRGALKLDDKSNNSRALEDSSSAIGATLSIGAEADIYDDPRNSIGLALRAEAGYSLMRSLEFESNPASKGGSTIGIPTSSTSLGSVNSSGASLFVALVGTYEGF